MEDPAPSVRRTTDVSIVRYKGKTIRRVVDVVHRTYPGGKGATTEQIEALDEKRRDRVQKYLAWKQARRAELNRKDPRKSA